ncbi:Cna B-type domain-containing protein [Blautia obeum]|uniref:Cna B-type domain-containing protein n=1 Tax=Blautia obeum TaxID=40520 RepID=UPI0018AC36B9|nr:Cna B-type domain-containing protein [Blautia obeum]
MSKKLHSGLKRTLAWMLVVALMVQGCMVVYADDFSSEPEAVVSDESSDEDASAESDLEIAEDEDTSADVEVSEDSNEDMDSDVTVEEEQEDEAGVDVFSDGSNVATFSDGADAQDETDDLKVDIGNVDIAGGQQYSYSRLYDKDGYVRYAIGTYPANGSSLTLKVGDKRGMMYHALYTSTSSKYTDYKKASWSKVSGNHSSSIYSVEWSSDDESIAKVVSGSSYGPYTTGMWVQGVSEGTTTIRSTFIPGTSYKDKVKTVTNTFTVTVTKAAEQVNIGDTFTLEGTATTPYLTTKATSTNVASLWGRTSEINYNASGDGLETAQASWKVWTDTGIITHRFCINFGEMVGRTPQQSDNTTYTPSPSDSMSDKFLRPCVMPPDGIYITSVSDKGSVVDGNVVFNKATGTSNYLNMYSYCISNQQKVDSATYYQNVQYTSSDETVVKKYKQDKYSVQLNALKAGTATLTASYQPVDENGDAVGDPITKDIKVIVCGFYIDEKAADGTNTIEMSLDDESITKKINYKVIDATGEGEATEPITWTVDNPTVASVDSDGVVKAKAAGETTVTAQYGDSSVNKDTVKIIVKGAGSLAFDKVESKIKKDGTDTIKATATYNGSTVRNADIKWESENPEIATVDGGKITGVGYGTTTVKASWTADNGKTYTNSATVNVVYDGLYLSDAQNEVTMPQGSKQEIVWTIQNMGKYSKGSTGEGYNPSSDVTWKSNDETVATVDSAGVITACNLAEGEKTASTTVTVSYKGIKVKDITVNVTENQNVVVNGDPVEIAGTKGESKTNSKGEDVTDTWKIGYHENGHGSLNAQFYGNGKDNIDIVSTEGAKVSVTGRTPSSGYIYLSHKYYVAAGNKQLCGVWQTIAIKVNGEAGLYLDKSSVSMKMGEADTATIMGTYIKADGTELGSDYWANKSNPKLSKLEMVDGDTSIVTAEADEKDGRLLHLTAVSPGKTTITIKCYPFEPTATCNVEVTSDARLVLTPADKLSVVQGDTATIEAKAWDGSAYVENPEITWQSYNTAIATVDDKGGVTGIKKGNVGVAATWNGVTSDPVQVTVVPSRNVSLTTEWNDSDNQDGSRPEKTTVQLTANGQPTGDPVELNADNNWTYEWKQLLAEDEEGTNIVYRVTADAPEDYTAKVTGSADDGFVVTYTHEIAKTSVTASVTWDDADDKDGIRPKSVSFQLKADGENVGDAITVNAGSNWTKTWEELPEKKAGKALTYTVEVSDIPTEEDQYTVTTSGDAANGFVFKASHVPAAAEITAAAIWDDAENQDGVRPEKVEAELYADGKATGDKVTLNAENNWKASFGEKELKKDGKTIEYTVQVSEVENYTCDVTGSGAKGFSLKYTHKTAVVNVTVSTVWNDKENQDGNRPTSYSVQLMADGVESGDKITLDTANDFSKTWTGLQKYRTGNVGEEIQYTVEVSGLAETYESVVSGTVADGFSVTNTYVPTSVEIPVSVTWDDAENQDGARIEAVEAELYADGEATGKKVTLNAENNWTAKFASVDVKKDGTRIKYEVKGTEADGYDVSVAGDILDEKGLVLTYKHIPAMVNVSARASWNDANNQDGIRPTDTLVQLYADGTALGDKAVIESNKEWTKTWSDLPKYKAGKEIAYSVIAYAVSGYTVKVTGSALEGYKAEYTHNVQKMNVTVQNAWNDLDNVVDSRPAQLVVEIYANGKTTGKRVTLTEANNWKATVSGLDRNAAGKRIQYTGKAVGTPAGYNISVSTDANGNIKLISNFTTYTKKLRLKLSKTSYVYNGKNAKPKVTVYNGRKKVSSKYYKVTYKNNKKVGYATVIVKGKGKFAKYAGKAAFTIKLKTLKKPSVKKGAKGTLNVSWKRDGQATKYVVQYSQSKKFKGKSTKTVTITNNKIGKTVLKGLTGKKNYYVRVRSCKAVNGREIWSSWSRRSSKVKVK